MSRKSTFAFGFSSKKKTNQPLDAESQNTAKTAGLLLTKGDISTAEVLINKLIRKFPNNADCCWLFGRLCAQKGKSDPAISNFKQCIQLYPLHADCYCSYGAILGELDKHNEEEKMYKQCLDLDPTNHRCHYHYGQLWERRGKYENAETHFKKAIAGYDEDSNYYVAYGSLLTLRRKYKEAQKHFEKALKINSNNDNAYFFYAKLLQKMGSIMFAITNTKKAIQLNRKDEYFKYLHQLTLVKPKVDMNIAKKSESVSLSSTHSETTISTPSAGSLNGLEYKNNINYINDSLSNKIMKPPMIKHDFSNLNAPGCTGDGDQDTECKQDIECKQYAENNKNQPNVYKMETVPGASIDLTEQQNIDRDPCQIEFERFVDERIKLNKPCPHLYAQFEELGYNDIRFVLDLDEETLIQDVHIKKLHAKKFVREIGVFKGEVHQFHKWINDTVSEHQQYWNVDALIGRLGNQGIWTIESLYRYVLCKADLIKIIGEEYTRLKIHDIIWNAMDKSNAGDSDVEEMVNVLMKNAFPALNNHYYSKNIYNPLREHYYKIVAYFREKQIKCTSFSSINKEEFASDLGTFIGKNNVKIALKQLFTIIGPLISSHNNQLLLESLYEITGIEETKSEPTACVDVEGATKDDLLSKLEGLLFEMNQRSDLKQCELMKMKQIYSVMIDPNKTTSYPLYGQNSAQSSPNSSSSNNNSNNDENDDNKQPKKDGQDNNRNNGGNGRGSGGNNNNNQQFNNIEQQQLPCYRPQCVANRVKLQKQDEFIVQLFRFNETLIDIDRSRNIQIQQLIHEQKVYITEQFIDNKKIKKMHRRKSKGNLMTTTNNLQSGYNPNPIYRVVGNIKVSRKLTEDVIPSMIDEEIKDLNGNSMVFKYIDKSSAMQYHDNELEDDTKCDIKIRDYDLHHKISKKPLYFIMTKQHKKERFEWKMMDKLFTKNEIIMMNENKIPNSSRKNNVFLQQLQHKDIIFKLLNDEVIENTKWHKMNIFNDFCNKRRMILSFDKEEFMKRVRKYIMDNKNDINLIPVVMFRENNHLIEHVLIIKNIDNNVDIGISLIYKIDTFSIEITGIHINKSRIYEQHILALPNHECHCLDSFTSNLDILKIGHVNDDINTIKAYKKKYNECKQFMFQFIDTTPTDNYISMKQRAHLLISGHNASSQINIINNIATNYNNTIYPNYANYSTPYF